jgi:CBS domain-containing protein
MTIFFRRPRTQLARFLDPASPILGIASRNPLVCTETDTLKSTLHFFATHRRLPVIGRRGECVGMVTSTDLLRALSQDGRMRTIQEIMRPGPLTLDSRASVHQALHLFRTARKGGYPLLSRGRVEGIITEADIIRHIRRPLHLPVSRLMTRRVLVARPAYSIREVAEMLSRGGYRRLPVVGRNAVQGIVTPQDILRYVYENGTDRKSSCRERV